MSDKKLFKKDNVSCLDLTTAKAIKGKIIANGDIFTYLKLKKTVAKRELYEMFHKGKINLQAKLEWSDWENGESDNPERKRPEGVLNAQTSNGEKTIYWHSLKHENIPLKLDEKGSALTAYNKNSIQDSLNSYLNQLRQKDNSHTPTILQINHLRDAITANMLGVICLLQKKYPGFVLLEDLTKQQMDKHFFDHNENIARRLESALYSKFQTMGLAPPHIKDIIRLREESRKRQKDEGQKNQQIKNNKNKRRNKIQNSTISDQFRSIGLAPSPEQKINDSSSESKINQISQIGAIVFVPERDTSKTCPYCEQKKERGQQENSTEFKKRSHIEKFAQHRFICGGKNPCGFDTYYFKPEEERAENYNPKVDESKKREEFDLFKDLNDNDKAAAYNIAKKVIDSKKWSG